MKSQRNILKNSPVAVSILLQFVAYALTWVVFAVFDRDFYSAPLTFAQIAEVARAYPLVLGSSLAPPVVLATAILLGWWLFSVTKARKQRADAWLISTCISALVLGVFWGTWFQLLMSGA